MKLNDDGTLDYELNDYVPPATSPSLGGSITAKGAGGAGSSSGTDATDPTLGGTVNETGLGKQTRPDAYTDPYSMITGLLGTAGTDPTAAVDQVNSKYGLQSGSSLAYYAPGAHGAGSGAVIGLPSSVNGGGYLAENADGTWSYNKGDSGASAAPAGGATGAGDTGSLSSFLTNLLQGITTNNSATTAQRGSLLDTLNGLIKSYTQPVSADDPTIKNATDAYTGDVNRSVNAYQKQAAERAYAEGVPSGAFDSEIGNATLAGGKSIGDFTTGLMNTETQSRRAAAASALGEENSVIGGQDTSNIDTELAGLNANLTEQGQNNQNSQFYDQLGIGSAYNTEMLNYLFTQLGLQP